MKSIIACLALCFATGLSAATGPSDRVTVLASEISNTKIVLDSSMGHEEESCTGSISDNEICRYRYVIDYRTTATIEVALEDSGISLEGQKITIDFTGEKATAISSYKNDIYYEIETEKTAEIISSRHRLFNIKMKLTPRLQSKTFGAMKIMSPKLIGDVITFESVPETGVEMATELAVSEKQILFYSMVWWKELSSPIVEVEARAGKLEHRIHLREIPVVRAGEKYRFTLYRSTKKANSLGRLNSAVLKAKM